MGGALHFEASGERRIVLRLRDGPCGGGQGAPCGGARGGADLDRCFVEWVAVEFVSDEWGGGVV